MNNEKGFILPVTLLISALFFLAFSFYLEQYISEKVFYREAEELRKIENLILLGKKDILSQLSSSKEQLQNFDEEKDYPIGTVHFTVQKQANIAIVNMTCTTDQLRKNHSRFTYNFEEQRIISWVELR